jgi:hypothetical protein
MHTCRAESSPVYPSLSVLALLCLFALGSIGTASAAEGSSNEARSPNGPSVTSSKIPSDLKEAFHQLDATLPAQQINSIRAGDISPREWNRTIGRKILEDWVAPAGSPLTAYFHKLGIDHPEDISGILITSYRLYLNNATNATIDLDRQVKIRRAYWSGLLTPEKAAAAEKLSAQAEHDPTLIKHAYTLDAKLVSNDFLATLIHPALSVPLELHEWALLDEWLLRQAAQRTRVDAHDYQEIVATLDPTLKVVATDLRQGTTLISTDQGNIGHVVIVTRQAGRLPELWRIDANLPAQGPSTEELHCWRPMAGIRPCASQVIGSLPPDARGRPRFYIQAGYAQEAGGTRGAQLSVWLWDGRAATPLYVSSYATGGEAEGQGATVDGDDIRIGRKDHFVTLDPCGACDGRQVVHRLKVMPDDHLEDLGTVSLTPELDLVDEIYTDIREGRMAQQLASQPVLALMRRSWEPMEGKSFQLLFIHEAETVTHDNGHTQLCFHAYYGVEGLMPPILFTFEGSGAHLRIIDARENAEACPPSS